MPCIYEIDGVSRLKIKDCFDFKDRSLSNLVTNYNKNFKRLSLSDSSDLVVTLYYKPNISVVSLLLSHPSNRNLVLKNSSYVRIYEIHSQYELLTILSNYLPNSCYSSLLSFLETSNVFLEDV